MQDLENALKETVNLEKLFHRSILITGATGLIGSFITDMLLYANREWDAGIRVCALARDEKRLKDRFVSSVKMEQFQWAVQDVTALTELPVYADYMIHAAGDGYPSAFREHPVETMTPALFGTYGLLQFCRKSKVEKFLYVSSGEVYGNISGCGYALTENDNGILDNLAVRSCYPMAKRCAETLCISFAAQYGVPVVIARPSHIYGACTSASDNRATAQFLRNVVNGESIRLNSAGKQMRSYTYVADCASGLLTVLLNGISGEAYNVAKADTKITIAEFAHILSSLAGTDCIVKEPTEKEMREQTPVEYAVLDPAKLEQIGWKGKYDIYNGIKSMLDTERQVL